MKSLPVLALAAALFGGVARAEHRDDLCPALRKFAEAVPAGFVSSVTLKTDWSGEPSAGCLRTQAPHEVAFCEYLVSDVSMEFMANNVRRALRCLGGDMGDLYLEHLAGKITSTRPSLVKKPVTVKLEFDSAPAEGLPFLTITVTAE